MNDEEKRTLDEIKSLLDREERIPAQKVHEWMTSPSREVQGAVFALLFEHPERLELPSVQERNEFFLHYLERCLRENAPGQYVEGRYAAVDALRAWFQRMWAGKQANEHTLEEVRDMLARLCREGNAELDDAIITAVLEHLFVKPDMMEFFRTWESDPVLLPIYKEAIALPHRLHRKYSDSNAQVERKNHISAVLIPGTLSFSPITDLCIEKYTLRRRPLILADGGTAESLAAYAVISKTATPLESEVVKLGKGRITHDQLSRRTTTTQKYSGGGQINHSASM